MPLGSFAARQGYCCNKSMLRRGRQTTLRSGSARAALVGGSGGLRGLRRKYQGAALDTPDPCTATAAPTKSSSSANKVKARTCTSTATPAAPGTTRSAVSPTSRQTKHHYFHLGDRKDTCTSSPSRNISNHGPVTSPSVTVTSLVGGAPCKYTSEHAATSLRMPNLLLLRRLPHSFLRSYCRTLQHSAISHYSTTQSPIDSKKTSAATPSPSAAPSSATDPHSPDNLSIGAGGPSLHRPQNSPFPHGRPPRTAVPTLRTSRSLPYTLFAVMATDQKRAHGGHSHHGHHHHHDNTYLLSNNKNDAGVRITRIGLFSNLGMAVAKGAGGVAFGSQALVADAWHSLTDLASDVLTLLTVSWSLKPPTDVFPSGFGKVESLGSLGVSGMLLGGGMFMCWSSLLTIYAHFFLDPAAAAETIAHMHSHGHSHGGHDHGVGTPSLHAAWLAAGTVAIKEWLYHATMKVARERKSSVLASNAVHHRVDSLTGIVTLVVVLGANLVQNAAWLDPVGGLFISLLVIKAGLENSVSALYELIDRSIDEEVRSSVKKHALKSLQDMENADVQHIVEVRDVAGVKSGQNYLVDIELAVPGSWTVEESKKVEDAVRTRVGGKVKGIRKVRVRFVPKEAAIADRFDEYIPGEVSQSIKPEEVEEDEHDHGHDHEHGNGKASGHSHGHDKRQ